MLMSLIVLLIPWIAFHVLRRKYEAGGSGGHGTTQATTWRPSSNRGWHKVFYPLMAPL